MNSGEPAGATKDQLVTEESITQRFNPSQARYLGRSLFALAERKTNASARTNRTVDPTAKALLAQASLSRATALVVWQGQHAVEGVDLASPHASRSTKHTPSKRAVVGYLNERIQGR